MSGIRIPQHRKAVLDGGARLILLPRHEVPLIAFEAVLRGGARLDEPGREGVAAVTAELLTRGAGDRDAYAFAEAVEGLGGALDAEVRSEAIHLHGQFLARDGARMLELLADAVQRPRFDAAELDKLRSRRIECIRAAKDSDPQSLLGTYGRSRLFGAHPYGKPAEGSEISLAAITRADVARFYEGHIGPERLTLVITGDFDPGWMQGAVERAFPGWRRAALPLPPLARPERLRGRRVWLIDAPGSTQSYFWIGNVGVARGYPLRAALEIASTAFGGSFGSVLMQALRVRSGLTYSAGAAFRRGSVAGEFAISSFTETASTREAVQIALDALGSTKRRGLDAAAIDSARSYLLGQYPLGFETAADWAAALAELDLYGLPESDIDDFGSALARVDAAQVRRVLDEAFPDATDVDVVLIGDAGRIRGRLGSLGAVRESSLAAPVFTAPD